MKRNWRTRPDPLAGIWDEAQRWLEVTPELEAKALFEHLLAARPGEIDGRALRTFQRRVDHWRRRHGPPREVFFAQVHVAGECIQTDWTNANELGVTIAGGDFPHLLVHSVLPFSNWNGRCPVVGIFAVAPIGLQSALWELGGVPLFSQTDQSSTATHQLKRDESRRGFNTDYVALCHHLGLEPRTIAVANPESEWRCRGRPGAFETAAQKPPDPARLARLPRCCRLRRVRSHGLPRLQRPAPFTRSPKNAPCLRPLPFTRFPETEELTVRVSSYSTARVKQCAYSMPARLIGADDPGPGERGRPCGFAHLGELIVSYPRSQGPMHRGSTTGTSSPPWSASRAPSPAIFIARNYSPGRFPAGL